MDNYCPISVLPCFSKIWERIIYNRLYSFYSENNTLHKRQFGFQEQHSTDHAIVYLVNEILNLLKINAILQVFFIDLTIAFDTVDHNILLKKLFHYGAWGNTFKLLQSYLHNRKQYIAYENSSKTEFRNVIRGVPQG